MKLVFIFVLIAFFTSGCFLLHHRSSTPITEEVLGFLMKAQEFQRIGKLDSSLIYFNKADSASPNTADILHERGLLKASMRRYDEALIDLNRSIEIVTDEREKQVFYHNRGLIYLDMNRMTEACEDWKNAGKSGERYLEKYCQ